MTLRTGRPYLYTGPRGTAMRVVVVQPVWRPYPTAVQVRFPDGALWLVLRTALRPLRREKGTHHG